MFPPFLIDKCGGGWLQDMVAAWKEFTSDEFTIECIHGNHLFVYDNAVRDEWFEIICDVLTGEGF